MEPFKLFPHQYPKLLKQVDKQPPFLYCAGQLPPDDGNKFLCVVGARRHSRYGRRACEYLIAGLRGYPIVIVSGLALGIDSIAHEAALANGLRTIAVPGSGLSNKTLYPPSHLALARRIIASGNTLLSPFECNQAGAIWTFPVRNQIMAALSHAVLIVEGRMDSGTLLTAGYALSIYRDIMTVPGSIFDELSHGPHSLSKDGATPVTSPSEILTVLGFEAPRPDGPDQQSIDFNIRSSSAEEKMIISHLRIESLTFSDLIEKTKLSTTTLNICISSLEMRGIVEAYDSSFRLKRSP